MNAPIIVTALIGDADFAYLDALRRKHFPPERNVLRAHLTMFHHLPPSCEGELLAMLQDEARLLVPDARLAGLINLGRGVAFRVESDTLRELRARIADRFADALTPQDKAGWRAHVTIQNKVAPEEARALFQLLSTEFIPRPLALTGVAAWWYRGGPWEFIAAYGFGTGRKMKTPR